MKLVKFELNRGQVGAFLSDPDVRKMLKPYAEAVYEAIPPTDGDPDERYNYKKGDKRVAGRYREKFIEESEGNDGRVSYKVGVKEANHSFFQLATLQKAVRAAGGKGKRSKKK